ncbi:hypothetical protein BH747_01385 [Enterococcus villorum]|uniref:Uncharacterized protein n=1 Tax=Enterococcus villorum TaxID=112904 RepID=A0A1V8YG07_9ENTE|nr:hypothetical protein BH747_01385 [Enterococcus villorum]OQO76687.1 hypothetical protein BH744_02450 [Enterococcus villorum]
MRKISLLFFIGSVVLLALQSKTHELSENLWSEVETLESLLMLSFLFHLFLEKKLALFHASKLSL